MTGRIRLTKRLGALTLDVDTAIGPGVTAVYGPSGAGKTSLLRAIAGLLRPESGRIEIAGDVWFDGDSGLNVPPARRRVGYVFQEPRLFPHLTVARNLRYGLRKDGDVDALVDLLGLGPLLARRPAALSGGEAQRVALGRALLSDPKVLLMDEPLSALDVGRKREILPYFEQLRAETARPILYVSHDIDEIARLADRVIVVEAGRAAPAQPLAEVIAGAAAGSTLGRTIAGGLLAAQVVGYHTGDGLTELRLGGETLWIPGRHGTAGETLRLRIDARDVMLALNRPDRVSALNVLPVRITAIDDGPDAGALVRLTLAGQPLAARVTRRSQMALGLTPGLEIYAVIKSLATPPYRVGRL
ncbi:MAG: molybdenum ABC transporter ATP-binding protein [Pseudomonadota bacterium]